MTFYLLLRLFFNGNIFVHPCPLRFDGGKKKKIRDLGLRQGRITDTPRFPWVCFFFFFFPRPSKDSITSVRDNRLLTDVIVHSREISHHIPIEEKFRRPLSVVIECCRDLNKKERNNHSLTRVQQKSRYNIWCRPGNQLRWAGRCCML